MLTNCELKTYIGIFSIILAGSIICLMLGIIYVINNYTQITLICFYLVSNVLLLDFILLFVIQLALEDLKVRKNTYKLQVARSRLNAIRT